MTTIGLAALLLISTGQAQTRRWTDGRERASALCERFNTQFRRDDCLKIVADGVFFNHTAIRACGALHSENYILDCLKAASGRDYLGAEVRKCQEHVSHAQIVECLGQAGRPYRPAAAQAAPSVDDLREVRRLVESGKKVEALALLDELIGAL
jgi:hypothetical protein